MLLCAACDGDRGTQDNVVSSDPEPSVSERADGSGEPQPPRPTINGRQASPCLIQDGRPLGIPGLRVIGTEPFWAVTTDGRCATYSHPDDQEGTRVWTRYSGPNNGLGTWSGALGGDQFELTVREEPGCSDGMSDKRYPYAAELNVHGEQLRGCAHPR